MLSFCLIWSRSKKITEVKNLASLSYMKNSLFPNVLHCRYPTIWQAKENSVVRHFETLTSFKIIIQGQPLTCWLHLLNYFYTFVTVPDPGKGVCADPVNKDAILEGGGPGPLGGNKERQLSPDKGRGKT